MTITRRIRVYQTLNALACVYTGFTGATFVLFLYSFGYSPFVVNMLVASAVLSVFIAEIPSGAASDIWGNRVVLLISGITLVGANALFVFSRNASLLLAGQLLSGISAAMLSGPLDAWVFDAPGFPKERIDGVCADKDKFQSWIMLTGGLIGGYLADINIRLNFALSIAAALVFTALVHVFIKETRERANHSRFISKINAGAQTMGRVIADSFLYCVKDRQVRTIIVYSGLMTFSVSAVFVSWSPLLHSYPGNNYSLIGLAWTLMQLAMLGGSTLSKRFAGHMKKHLLIASLLIGLVVAALALTGSFYLALIFILMFEFALGIANPLKEAILNLGITAKVRATILSFQSMFSSLMYFFSMLITGWLSSAFSIHMALLFSGLCMIVIALLYARLVWREDL